MTRTPRQSPLDIAPCLMQAARLHSDLLTSFFAARGYEDVTPAFFALMSLLDAGGTRSSVLAERAGVSKQAMSKMVRHLEQRHYLEQVPDPADTRAKVVRSTRRGDQVRQQCAVVRAEIDRRVVDVLGVSAAAEFKRQLQAVVAGLGPDSG